MRHIVTLLALLALVAAFVVDPPFAAAKKQDPGAAALAKLENAARKSVKGVLRDTSKRIRARSGAAARQIKQLAKAVKKGKGLDTLTGMPFAGKKGQEPTPAQLSAVFDRYVEVLFAFHGETTLDLEDAYERLSGDAAYGALTSASSTASLVGGGGLVDEVALGLRRAWGDGRAGMGRASAQLQAALRARDFELTVAPFDPPRLVPTPLLAPNASILQSPVLLEVLGSSDGDLVVVMPSRLPSGLDGFETLIEARDVASGLVRRLVPSATSTVAVVTRFRNVSAGAFTVSSGVSFGKGVLPLTTVGVSVPTGSTTSTITGIDDPSFSLVVDGKGVAGGVVFQAVVPVAAGRVEAVYVMVHDEKSDEPLFSFDYYPTRRIAATPGVPFELRIPPVGISQDFASILYYPSGPAGPVLGTFGTVTSTIAVTFDRGSALESAGFVLTGDIFLSSDQSPQDTVPAHFEIRVAAEQVERYF